MRGSVTLWGHQSTEVFDTATLWGMIGINEEMDNKSRMIGESMIQSNQTKNSQKSIKPNRCDVSISHFAKLKPPWLLMNK